METPVETCLTIVADSRLEAIERLNASVDQLRKRAIVEKSRGILVTRRGAGKFTVELTSSVPYGMTMESTLEDRAR